MKKLTQGTMMVLILGTLAAFTAGSAKADEDFAKKHPRRAQVMRRDRREKKKNNAAAANGKITQQQAQKLDKEDSAIAHQERADAAANGGHITKSEQRDLNREENNVNRQRRRDERMDAKKNQGTTTLPATAHRPPEALQPPAAPPRPRRHLSNRSLSIARRATNLKSYVVLFLWALSPA